MDLINKCRVCGSNKIEKFFDLGEQPFANALLKNQDNFAKEKKYPLSLSFCNDCSLVQLDYTANPSELFENYFWITSTSGVAKQFAEVFCNEALKRNNPNNYILEIASNDGTFLKPFQSKGYAVLGVEPAQNICQLAISNGIPTENVFFNYGAASKIIEDRGYPSIVYARNVLPHVSDTHDFVKGLKHCVSDEALLILEVHYAGKICDELQYDSIYHEHLCYFTLKSICRLLESYELYAYDIIESPISGGSIVLYISNAQKNKSEALLEFEAFERTREYNSFDLWKAFAQKSYLHRELLNNLINKEAADGKRMIGYGASARGSTMLNFCDIADLSCIIDQNKMKQGMYTPGTHIKIMGADEAMQKSPDTILLLAWNFKEEIIAYLEEHYSFNGSIIIPFPFPPSVYQREV